MPSGIAIPELTCNLSSPVFYTGAPASCAIFACIVLKCSVSETPMRLSVSVVCGGRCIAVGCGVVVLSGNGGGSGSVLAFVVCAVVIATSLFACTAPS